VHSTHDPHSLSVSVYIHLCGLCGYCYPGLHGVKYIISIGFFFWRAQNKNKKTTRKWGAGYGIDMRRTKLKLYWSCIFVRYYQMKLRRF